jgi:hypothetical protein
MLSSEQETGGKSIVSFVRDVLAERGVLLDFCQLDK